MKKNNIKGLAKKRGRPKKVETKITQPAEVKEVGKLGKPKPRPARLKRIPPL